ncbi:RNA polymerase sigma-32 factor [Rickettsiales bacterium Ac37b]|nr:RNA polymerase sigma-32 factor [Rickettsiales bacterium Ac37b]
MSTMLSLPVLNGETGFLRYLQEIRKIPSLGEEEEYMLAKRFTEHQDISAAHKLVTSHLKLVAKVAMSFKNYGLPMIELVSEGNIGLMQAVKKFNPELGFRLSTYAVWWIKAAIQEYILKSWSLVKIGTTSAQKKLFFNLNKLKKKIQAIGTKSLDDQEINMISNELQVSTAEVKEMEKRMSGNDISLNALASEYDDSSELIDLLPETRANQEKMLVSKQEYNYQSNLLQNAINTLTDREKHILTERRLKDEPATLEELSQYYNISRERIRQIEVRILEKLRGLIALQGNSALS